MKWHLAMHSIGDTQYCLLMQLYYIHKEREEEVTKRFDNLKVNQKLVMNINRKCVNIKLLQ